MDVAVGYIYLLIVLAVGFFAFVVCEILCGRRGLELIKRIGVCAAIIGGLIYVLQLVAVFPKFIEKKEISSTTTDHYVTVELWSGGYSFVAVIPMLGILEISGRAIYVRTESEKYKVWTGDDLDSPDLSTHSLRIFGAHAEVVGFDFDWRGTAAECSRRSDA